ncbi:MAG: sugar phosphate isomerase/epimerase family protein, partial [Candidatus Bathyarchaeia archaeon]
RFLVFGSPQQRNVMEGVSKGQAWNFAKEIFSECSRFAEDYGAVICVEPLARHLTNFINTAEEALRLIEEISNPNLRLALDVFSMADEEKPMDEVIRSGKDHLAHFHANDDNKLGPGFGGVDYKPIVRALKEINYRGFISVEVFDFTPGPEEIARKSLENLKKFWGENY